MYVVTKRRAVKKKELAGGKATYDFYICESSRKDGEIKSRRIYAGTLGEAYFFSMIAIQSFLTAAGNKLFLKGAYFDGYRELITWKILAIQGELAERPEYSHLKASFQEEAERMKQRASSNNFTTTQNSGLIGEIIKAGYKSLSKKYHPDKGGTTEQMAELNNVYESLKASLGL